MGEASDIQAFHEKFRDDPDVVFITVSSDNDPDTTRDFMEEKGYDFPVVLDGGLARSLKIFAWPTTRFVDRDGRIVFSYQGASLRLVNAYAATRYVELKAGDLVVAREAIDGAGAEARPPRRPPPTARRGVIEVGPAPEGGVFSGRAGRPRSACHRPGVARRGTPRTVTIHAAAGTFRNASEAPVLR